MNRPKPKTVARKALLRRVTNAEFEVEQIMDRKEAFGVTYYQVKWLGYNEITWEPASNLIGNDLENGAYELVQEFEDSLLNPPPQIIPLSITNNLKTEDKNLKSSKDKQPQLQLQEEDLDTHFSELSNNYFKPQAHKRRKQVEQLSNSFNCQLSIVNNQMKKYSKAKSKEFNQFISKGKDQQNMRNKSSFKESGSLSKGDIIDKICQIQFCSNDNGQKEFYSIVSWKVRKDGTQPSKSRIRTSALTKHSVQSAEMYRQFVEKNYLSKYFIK